MNRRTAIRQLATFFLTTASFAHAQQPKKVSRVGLLSGAADPAKPVLWEPFFEALRQLGYSEGKNIILERRFANGKSERVPEFAVDLARLKVDVIVVTGTTETRAAKQATGTIPIVMVTAPDPIESGLVASLSHPGGNVTGLSMLAPELTGKRIEIIKEAAQANRIALLHWAADTTSESIRTEAESAAKALKVKLTTVAVREVDRFADAFSTMKRERSQAVVVPLRLLFFNQRARIVELAEKNRLPAIYEIAAFVDAGGLMSYGPLLPDLYRRAATYVDKILKGAKPADLPVEQPMKFEFVINLKTAKQIGLTIPQWTLMKADKVIK
jgi:putative ABC transport system substrate-binding protein